MSADPNKISDPAQIRALMKNAERHERPDIVSACQRRLFELGGKDYSDPVERRLWEAVAALEEMYHAKHGRRQAAGYTRRKIAKDGAVATLSGWALKPAVTPGFETLVENGMAEFTGEYVIAQYPDRFEANVVEAARERLLEYGVALPEQEAS